jgi:hypothetical protein
MQDGNAIFFYCLKKNTLHTHDLKRYYVHFLRTEIKFESASGDYL